MSAWFFPRLLRAFAALQHGAEALWIVEVFGNAVAAKGDAALAGNFLPEEARAGIGFLVARERGNALEADHFGNLRVGMFAGELILMTLQRIQHGLVAEALREAKLDEDLMAFGIAYRRAGMPRVFVLVAEQAINATQATGWWQGGGNAADLRVVENAFMDRMEKSGFTFIDPEVLHGKVKLEAIGADPNLQQAREIGVKTGAEIVIVGRAIAKPLGEMQLDNGTFYSAVANVSARAVRTDTGEVLAAVEFTGTAGRGFEQTTAGRNALSEGGRQLARDLFAKIGKVWTREQSGARRITMTVRGVDDYGRLATFKNVMVQSVRGVKDVQERSMEEGKADLDVTLAGTSASFATDLATRKFQGFAVKVKKVTPAAVEVELK